MPVAYDLNSQAGRVKKAYEANQTCLALRSRLVQENPHKLDEKA